jgi:hypothetical protein
MRACSYCSRKKKFYIISSESESYSEYYRFKRRCSLAPNNSELDKQLKIKEKLDKKIVEAMRVAIKAEAKTIRLRKQRRLAIKRLRKLGDREALNIKELENNEILVVSVIISSKKNPSASSSFPSLKDFLAQEHPGLFGKNL